MTHSNLTIENELKQMYARTEHWISDYVFFEDEMKFFFNLLDRYFIGVIISDSYKLDLLKKTALKLTELDAERQSIAKDNKQVLLHIAKLLKNELAFDQDEFRETYADIENEHVGFLKRYQSMRKEIYALGVLLAADNGANTRKNISRKGQDLADAISDKIEAKFDELRDTFLGKTRNRKSTDSGGLESKV